MNDLSSQFENIHCIYVSCVEKERTVPDYDITLPYVGTPILSQMSVHFSTSMKKLIEMSSLFDKFIYIPIATTKVRQ